MHLDQMSGNGYFNLHITKLSKTKHTRLYKIVSSFDENVVK